MSTITTIKFGPFYMSYLYTKGKIDYGIVRWTDVDDDAIAKCLDNDGRTVPKKIEKLRLELVDSVIVAHWLRAMHNEELLRDAIHKQETAF